MIGCVYCPRCNRSVPKDKLAERSKELIDRFENTALEEGRCPVCGTDMIDIDEVERTRGERKD